MAQTLTINDWTQQDADNAQARGWNVFTTSLPAPRHVELERVDCPETPEGEGVEAIYTSDGAAAIAVKAAAKQGDALSLKACAVLVGEKTEDAATHRMSEVMS